MRLLSVIPSTLHDVQMFQEQYQNEGWEIVNIIPAWLETGYNPQLKKSVNKPHLFYILEKVMDYRKYEDLAEEPYSPEKVGEPKTEVKKNAPTKKKTK